MREGYLKIKDIKIHYLTYGSGQPLLFLHGHRSDCFRFKKITDRLAKKYQVFIPDLPGFGKSEELKKPHTLKNFLPILEGFVNKLKLDDYILGGVSLGASLALFFSQKTKSKIKKIVLFGPVVDNKFYKFNPPYIFLAKILLKLLLIVPGLTFLVDKIIKNDFLFRRITYLTLPRRLRQKEIIDYEVRQWRQMSMKVWGEVCLSMLNFSLVKEKPLEIPGLFILSEMDRYFDIKMTKEKLLKLFPNGEVVVLKNQRHVDPGEIPDKLLDDLSYIFDKI